ncbi:hypothetical protein BU16DRAFT_618380 [Lophium mytilinum]|uniref:VOC domain-containing protein n=1 Tax=Lophium mytilinum TaxID=390894 RepID=A0A6A6QTU6_9PEZI|nr:hypothetical protein BU16DRAFT_618380 [Lophium mytilinum]
MTINHLFLLVTPGRLPALRTFYRNVLQPVGYTEMIVAFNETIIGFGSDYPYLWLKALPEGQTPTPTHIAFDAPNNEAVNAFHAAGLREGGKDQGAPGIRPEMSRQPYYAAFIIDPDGNNIEATCVDKRGVRKASSD